MPATPFDEAYGYRQLRKDQCSSRFVRPAGGLDHPADVHWMPGDTVAGTRTNLLFTMSDNTHAAAKAGNGRICSSQRTRQFKPSGGARRDRTDDLLLAKQALSQLSYGPKSEGPKQRMLVGLGRFELPTSRLSSARSNQLSYKPGTGVSDQQPVIRRLKVTSDYRILITELLVRACSSVG